MKKNQDNFNYIVISATEKVQVVTNVIALTNSSHAFEADDLLSLIEDALAGKDIAELDAVFIDVGPGSFTGIRASMSLVKGLSATGKLKVIPFTSFDLLSYNASKQPRIEVVAGFSNYVYARFYAGGKSKMDCLTFDELALIVKEQALDVYTNVQGIIDKLASILGSQKGLFLAPKDMKTIYEKYNNNKLEKVDFVPIYLRASQAEIMREAKLRNK